MRVLIQSRKNLFTLKGGDTVQLTKTKEELDKLGVEADISLELEPDLSSYDLVHLTNVTRIQETYLQMKNAVRQHKPVILSTIYWPVEEFEKSGQVGIRKIINRYLSVDTEEKIKAVARYVKDEDSRNEATSNLWKVGYTKMQDYVVQHTSFFLPNSEIEMEMFSKNFNVPMKNYNVVPNAIDSDIATKQLIKTIPEKFEKFRDAVICVGRIEPRKNQVMLAEALDNSQYKVLFVGAVSENQKGYFNELKKIVDTHGNYYYMPYIDNTELYQLYRVCKVSALPSWYDTPGLVSLEAGVMGCNLAISNKGSTKEYFGELASYCEPDDMESIRKSVDEAYRMSQNGKLQQMILDRYTWKRAAEETLTGYKTILEG